MTSESDDIAIRGPTDGKGPSGTRDLGAFVTQPVWNRLLLFASIYMSCVTEKLRRRIGELKDESGEYRTDDAAPLVDGNGKAIDPLATPMEAALRILDAMTPDDAVQEAYKRLATGKRYRKIAITNKKTFVILMCCTIRSLISNARGRNKKIVPHNPLVTIKADGIEVKEAIVVDAAFLEENREQLAIAMHAIGQLKAPLALEILGVLEDSPELKAREIAEELQVDVKKVYVALKLIRRAARRILGNS